MVEELADTPPGRFDGSLGGFAQERLELGEDLLDGVQVGARQATRINTLLVASPAVPLPGHVAPETTNAGLDPTTPGFLPEVAEYLQATFNQTADEIRASGEERLEELRKAGFDV
jgi:hypothetical protein